MSPALKLRLRRLHDALGSAKSADLSSLEVQTWTTAQSQSFLLDFKQGRTQEDLQNVAFTLIASIASLKDHLKYWCKQAGKPFGGDQLIDSHREVAIVHDLWNTDKHAELKRPRSGHRPHLEDIRQGLRISTGENPGAMVGVQIDLGTGKPRVISSDGGGAYLAVNAFVVDEDGTKLGDFIQICELAIHGWEQELQKVGALPPP